MDRPVEKAVEFVHNTLNMLVVNAYRDYKNSGIPNFLYQKLPCEAL